MPATRNNSTNSTRDASVVRRLMATCLAAAALFVAGLGVAPAQPVDAWAWSPTVTLQGKIGCNYATSNHVTWAWVSASNGEAGWATLGPGGMTRPYSFTFKKAPTTTMTVTVKWGCSTDGQHRTSFGVNRPSTGTTATRNICYWSPCWL